MAVRLLQLVRKRVVLVPVGLDDRKMSLDDSGQDFVGGVGGIDDLDPIASLDAKDEVALRGGVDSAGASTAAAAYKLILLAAMVHFGRTGSGTGPRMCSTHRNKCVCVCVCACV